MIDKLTLQDCFKYPNAKINYYSSQTGNIVAQFENIFDFIALRKFDAENEITNCRLILRDLTQLTDEELQHIIKMYEDEPNEFIEIENKLDRIYLLDVKKCDYLREKNIMIEPEDWFESGKAVRE